MAILHGLEPTHSTRLTHTTKQCTLCHNVGTVVDFVSHPDDRSNGGIMLLCSDHSRQYHLALVLGRVAEFLAYASEQIRTVVR